MKNAIGVRHGTGVRSLRLNDGYIRYKDIDFDYHSPISTTYI